MVGTGRASVVAEGAATGAGDDADALAEDGADFASCADDGDAAAGADDFASRADGDDAPAMMVASPKTSANASSVVSGAAGFKRGAAGFLRLRLRARGTFVRLRRNVELDG